MNAALVLGAAAVAAFVPACDQSYRVPSSAMEPTLHCARPSIGCEAASADRIVVDRRKSLERGDIVVFETPAAAAVKCGAGGTFVKRLIGLPGERWEERAGYVFIDGKRLNEPYVKRDRRDERTMSRRTIPRGSYFMMGDNRGSSCDSREWGSVPRKNLVGVVVEIHRGSTTIDLR